MAVLGLHCHAALLSLQPEGVVYSWQTPGAVYRLFIAVASLVDEHGL